MGGEARVGDDESTEVAWFHTDALPGMSATLEERIRTAIRTGEGTRLLP